MSERIIPIAIEEDGSMSFFFIQSISRNGGWQFISKSAGTNAVEEQFWNHFKDEDNSDFRRIGSFDIDQPYTVMLADKQDYDLVGIRGWVSQTSLLVGLTKTFFGTRSRSSFMEPKDVVALLTAVHAARLQRMIDGLEFQHCLDHAINFKAAMRRISQDTGALKEILDPTIDMRMPSRRESFIDDPSKDRHYPAINERVNKICARLEKRLFPVRAERETPPYLDAQLIR